MKKLIDLIGRIRLNGPAIKGNYSSNRSYSEGNIHYRSEDCDCESGDNCSECGSGDCTDCDCTSDNCDDC